MDDNDDEEAEEEDGWRVDFGPLSPPLIPTPRRPTSSCCLFVDSAIVCVSRTLLAEDGRGGTSRGVAGIARTRRRGDGHPPRGRSPSRGRSSSTGDRRRRQRAGLVAAAAAVVFNVVNVFVIPIIFLLGGFISLGRCSKFVSSQ